MLDCSFMCVLAIEHCRFYEHFGVDFAMPARAWRIVVGPTVRAPR
jgi:membrane peptidoglycan carboxypeptidase